MKKTILYPGPSLNFATNKIRDITIYRIPVVKLQVIRGSSLIFVKELEEYENVAFTSPRTIDFILKDYKSHGKEPRQIIYGLKEKTVFAVGKSTKEALFRVGLSNIIVPSIHNTVSLAKKMVSMRIKNALLPRSRKANKQMVEILAKAGIRVKEIFVYDAFPINESIEKIRSMINEGVFTHVLVTSSYIGSLICDCLKDFKGDIIAIGKPTYFSLKKCGVKNKIFVSKTALIREIIENLVDNRVF